MHWPPLRTSKRTVTPRYVETTPHTQPWIQSPPTSVCPKLALSDARWGCRFCGVVSSVGYGHDGLHCGRHVQSYCFAGSRCSCWLVWFSASGQARQDSPAASLLVRIVFDCFSDVFDSLGFQWMSRGHAVRSVCGFSSLWLCLQACAGWYDHWDKLVWRICGNVAVWLEHVAAVEKLFRSFLPWPSLSCSVKAEFLRLRL